MIARSRRRRLTASLLAVALLAPAGVAGPAVARLAAQATAAAQPGVGAWSRARLDGRLDARTRAGVERVIDSAFALGVPADPLVTKALEGASKGGSSDAIVRAVRLLAVDLAGARQALGPASVSEEIAAGAEALHAGVEGKTLERLRRDRPGQPLSIALGVLADLIGRGVPVASATGSVLALTKAGIADEQLVAFRRDVERDVGMGAAPAAAATLRASSLTVNLARDGAASASAGARPPSTAKPRP